MLRFFRIVSGLGGLLVAVLISITAASVIARYVFARPIQWTEEMSGLLMIWIVFIGAIGCEVENSHLRIDALTECLPKTVRRWLDVSVGVASIWLIGYMGWLGYMLAEGAVMRKTQILKVSFWWLDIAVTVGAAGLVILVALRVWHLILGNQEVLDTGDLRPSSSQSSPEIMAVDTSAQKGDH